MTVSEPTIFVVDDDSSIRTAVSRLLRSCGFHDVVALDSARSVLERHDPSVHGCIILDVAMPGFDGLQLQQELSARGDSLPIVFLTGRGDIPMSVRAMKQGASDFLTKPVQRTALIDAVHTAIARDQVEKAARAELADIQSRLATLTPRELEVLHHIVAGKLNKQTAAELGTVEKTIKVHRAHIMEKMRVKSVAELVHLTDIAGLTPPPSSGIGQLDQSPMLAFAQRR